MRTVFQNVVFELAQNVTPGIGWGGGYVLAKYEVQVVHEKFSLGLVGANFSFSGVSGGGGGEGQTVQVRK